MIATGRFALGERLAGRARATARGIGERLLAAVSEPPVHDPNFERFASKRLNGTVGYALAFAALATATGDPRYERGMHEQLKRAAEAPGPACGLFDGISGLRAAAAVAAAIEPRYASFVERCDAVVEASLLAGTAAPSWCGDYDVISGWSGMRLARCIAGPRPPDALAELLHYAIQDADRWNCPSAPDADEPSKHWLGMAHGVSGALATLALTTSEMPASMRDDVLRAAHVVAAAARLRDGALAWPRALEDPEDEPCRAVWCVGAAGIGSALLSVGQRLGDGQLERIGREALERLSATPGAAMRLGGHGICHGTIGNATILFAAARTTGSAACASGCERLVTEAMDGIDADAGRCWSIGNDGVRYDALGELYGLAGVALALLSMTGDFDTRWLLCHALPPH